MSYLTPDENLLKVDKLFNFRSSGDRWLSPTLRLGSNEKGLPMRTFSNPTRPSRTHFGQRREASSILHLQRTIGNQEVQRRLQSNGEERHTVSIGTTSLNFGHDFSRIPVRPPTADLIPTRLAINKPGDKSEQEADRVAAQVMRMPEPKLQRACACGGVVGPDGECAACRTKRLQRETNGAGPSVAPRIVHDVLRSPGTPLEPPVRRDMESRFGHEFRDVRIHADARAAASAAAVSAQAYTVGRSIVFNTNQYQPHTTEGRSLLAHELAHVTQQGPYATGSIPIQEPTDFRESAADALARAALNGAPFPASSRSAPVVARTFQASKSNCVAGRNNAPVDVNTELPAMDVRAGGIAGDVATALEVTPVDPKVRAALAARFGLPPVLTSGRSLNRLTGASVADQDAAIAGEVNILARRFRLSERLFSQPMFYRCVGPDGGSTIGGCTVNHATCGAAGTGFSCAGVGAIFMCPDFWNRFGSTDERALVLVHESFHIMFANVLESVPRGSGGKYRNASCYESFASDITGVPVSDTCPP